MKKQTILNRLFLLVFLSFLAGILSTTPPKKTLSQILQQEFQTIESFFDENDMKGLLKQVASKNFSSINSLEECSNLFSCYSSTIKGFESMFAISNKQCDSREKCLFDRTENPKYRKAFEDKILEQFEKELLPNLIKDDELSFTYTSFACGKLFQDFVVLNRIIRLIQSKDPNTKINIKINLVDSIKIGSRIHNYVKTAAKQLKTYLTNKGVSVRVILFLDTKAYVDQCKKDTKYNADIATCADFNKYDLYGETTEYGFRDLILNCLNKNGMFFRLDKLGQLRSLNMLKTTFDNNPSIAQKYHKQIVNWDSYPLSFRIPENTSDRNIVKPLPALFYGKTIPNKGVLNIINALYLDTGAKLNPLLVHTIIQ